MRIDLCQVRPGQEPGVVKELQPERGEDAAVFKCLGRPDVVSVRTVEELNHGDPLLRAPGVHQSASLFAFTWRQNRARSLGVREIVGVNGAATLTFLRLCSLVGLFPGDLTGAPIKLELISRLTRVMPSSAALSLYPTLGGSQFVLLQAGNRLEDLLEVSASLRELSLDHTGLAKNGVPGETPLFESIHTLPLVAYTSRGTLRTDGLEGSEIQPIVFMGCGPGSKERVAREWVDSGARVYSAHGRPDLIAFWEKPVPTAKAVDLLLEQREWGMGGGLRFTSTVLLGNASPGDETIPAPVIEQPFTEQLDDVAKALNHIADLAAAIQDPLLRTELNQLQQALQLVRSALHGSRWTDFSDIIWFAHATALQVLALEEVRDLDASARRNLQMRSSALRDGVATRTIDPLLRPAGIRESALPEQDIWAKSITAMSFVPHFIHQACIESLPEEWDDWLGNWPGFVLFGDYRGPMAAPGENLVLPNYFICSPAESTWMLSHEVWHTFYNRAFRDQHGDVLNEIQRRFNVRSPASRHASKRIVSELFANWMDLVYCFQGDRELWLQLVWSHWLMYFSNRSTVPPEHLLRSFLVDIYARGELSRVVDILDRNPAKAFVAVMELWRGYEGFLIDNISGMGEWFTGLDDATRQTVVEDSLHLVDLLVYFERTFINEDLRIALGTSRYDVPAMARELLSEDAPPVRSVDNPVMLAVELARRTYVMGDVASAASSAAIIFSLASGCGECVNLITGFRPKDLVKMRKEHP